MTREIYLPTCDDTYAFGIKIGNKLRSGAVLLLTGDLGAGKTQLAKGIAKGLESDDEVSSPTFALINIYCGRCPIYHLDLYRLHNSYELDDIGFFEMIESDGVAIIEWAEKFVSLMPEHSIRITMERLSDRAGRKLTIEAKNVDISD
ncbi:MAG: tRNA (adenosine(37)-N6)-threonylcarbamoyltransferase complex ATPase subunit type 1 TsaE [Negativicutes bacterium]